MKQRHILIVGNSLSAEAMTQILGTSEGCVTSHVGTIRKALGILRGHSVDALLIIGTPRETSKWSTLAQARYPGLPILLSDLCTPTIQVITSRCIEARLDQVLATIDSFPRRAALAVECEAA